MKCMSGHMSWNVGKLSCRWRFSVPLQDFISNRGTHLPTGDVSSNEPMLLFPKRTFQPSTIRHKRNHGFFSRKATKGGRRVIARRIAKGRSRITA